MAESRSSHADGNLAVAGRAQRTYTALGQPPPPLSVAAGARARPLPPPPSASAPTASRASGFRDSGGRDGGSGLRDATWMDGKGAQ
jgi:hypothetical protein